MSEDLSESRTSGVEVTGTPKKERRAWIAISGVALQLPFLFAFGVTLVMLIRSFATYPEDRVVGDTKFIIGLICEAALPTILSLTLALPGVILSCISVIASSHRERWFFYSNLLLSAIWFLFFPIGTVFAIVLSVPLIRKRHEYFTDSKLGGSMNSVSKF